MTTRARSSAGGAKEKDLTLQIARRLKAAIESRLGLRVLLTRDSDDDVHDRSAHGVREQQQGRRVPEPARRTGRLAPAARGAQVYTLGLSTVRTQPAPRPIAAAHGAGARRRPRVHRSGAVGSRAAALCRPVRRVRRGILVRQFAERSVAALRQAGGQAPMRVLMGANMPAVLIEIGFLSNADDEKALTHADSPDRDHRSMIAAITEVRRGVPAAQMLAEASDDRRRSARAADRHRTTPKRAGFASTIAVVARRLLLVGAAGS